jgi:hypothetical protein
MATSDPILTRHQAVDDGALAAQGEITPEEARRCRWALARLARSHAVLRVVLAAVAEALAVDTEQGTAPNPVPRPVERSPAPPTP